MELNNLIKFHAEMEGCKGITSPIPYPAISNESVLVMEYVEGIEIDDVEAIRKEGDDPSELASRILDNYMYQVLDKGFFHADPHPGNILVRGHEVVWIDLGMVGILNGSQRQLVSQMLKAFAANDSFMLMEAVMGISRKHGTVDEGRLLGQLSQMLDKYVSADLKDVNMGEAFGEMVEVLRGQNLILMPSVTMLVRGIMTIEGSLDDIAPNLSIMKAISKKVMEQSVTPEHVESRMTELASATIRSAEAATKLPSQISNTLTMLNRGELSMKGDVSIDTKALATIYASVGRLSLALISMGLFLGSSILCTTNMHPQLFEVPLLGVLGYLGALVLGVYVIVVTFKSRHAMKNNKKLD